MTFGSPTPGSYSQTINQPFGWPILSLRNYITSLLFGTAVPITLNLSAQYTGLPWQNSSTSDITYAGSPTGGSTCSGFMASDNYLAGDCSLNALGNVAARTLRAQATLPGLIVGHTYFCTINLKERERGTTNPYIPSIGGGGIQFVAASTTEVTPFIDMIPEYWDNDFEIAYCNVQDITP